MENLNTEVSITMPLGQWVVLQQLAIHELAKEDGSPSFSRTMYNVLENNLKLEQYLASILALNERGSK